MKKSLLTILVLCFFIFSACAQPSKTTGETMGTTINVTVNGVTKTATMQKANPNICIKK